MSESSRRSFLVSVGAMVLGKFMSGCAPSQEAFSVLLLSGSIPPQLIGEFRKQFSPSSGLDFRPEETLADLFAAIKNSQKVPNLITLGDSWLQEAISQKLIEPLEAEKITNWSKLPLQFSNLMKRDIRGNLDLKGKVWGAPYRWGSLVIAYRSDKLEKFGWTPQNWGDLWREEIKDRLSLVDQPREVIGLTLHKLGYSYNTANISSIRNLKSELLALQKQVKFYASDYYLQPLVMGDTWVAVGWSGDILPLTKRYPNIKAIVPRSGTSLWCDVWVKPKNSGANELVEKWIDFCWQTRSANQISLFTNAVSPTILQMSRQEIAPDIRDNSLLLPDNKILDQSEFILPLSAESSKQYLELWREMRNSGTSD
jgi:putative spermidine/putrescine transport system substrate-binding protein